MSVPRQGAEEDGEAPTAARALGSLSSPRPQAYPAHSVPFPRNPTNDLASLPTLLGCSGGKVGAEERGGREKPEASRPRQSGHAILHARHVGPISHAGLAARRSW